MVLQSRGRLDLEERPVPEPGPGQVLLRVQACGVCRTDLHLFDEELPNIPYPIVPGHEIVGTIEAVGEGVRFTVGDRCGVPWLGWTCGACSFCLHEQENLCDSARFTGYQINGGYADYTIADEHFCFQLSAAEDDVSIAPLLCAGLIGFRCLSMCGDAKRLGLYGFGAAAHILAQVAVYQGRDVFAFTRPGDVMTQGFAKKLGAVWVGGSDTKPDVQLDAAIIFAPVGTLVPTALKAVRKGGVVVCGGIHMSDIPAFAYADLWGERQLRSVANLTRRDAEEFLALAPKIPVRTTTEVFPLEDAAMALQRLRDGTIEGAGVLVTE